MATASAFAIAIVFIPTIVSQDSLVKPSLVSYNIDHFLSFFPRLINQNIDKFDLLV